MKNKITLTCLGLSAILLTTFTVNAVRLSSKEARYLSLSVDEKIERLKTMSESSEYSGLYPTKGANGWAFASSLLPTYLHTTFKRESDFMPEGREKVIHPYGSTGEVELIIDEKRGQTGILEDGGKAIARLSVASMGGPFTGALALKFPVEGQQSVNFIAMHSLDGQGNDRNMFRKTFSNIVPKPKATALKIGGFAFQVALATMRNAPKSALQLPMHEALSTFQNGTLVRNWKLYEQIYFEPTVEATELFDQLNTNNQDFRRILKEFPIGTNLYRVYIKKRKADSTKLYIGRIVLNSRLTPSSFGDRELFFQHPRPISR